ncbi:hypothetical protein [Christiangramia aquimixticola]|uniref:hypothetical protein n=1 Tax=Christiangramia aquimixticola TaxID=1697558 RepID=UPI003AA863B0
MKNYLAFCLLLLSANLCFAQETSEGESLTQRDTGKNDISVNAFNLVAFGIIDVTYERVINNNSSWALEAFYHPSKDDYIDEAYYKDFSLTGKYKHFFSSSYARGFYVHSFGMFSSGEYESDYIMIMDGPAYYETEKYSDFALGFGLGGKFISPGGFMVDLSSGIGRNLFNSQSPKVVGQFMINLGYRF